MHLEQLPSPAAVIDLDRLVVNTRHMVTRGYKYAVNCLKIAQF